MTDDRPSMIDPYRTLGLEPGSPMPEVKRAYRRLAKANHPDSAGEAALPRFLAIHEAYEAIRTGRPLPSARRAAGGPVRAEPGRAEPWRADPERARAARERARRRTGSQASGGGTGTGTGTTGTRAAGTSGASSSRSGPRPTGRSGTSGETDGDAAGGTAAGAASGGSRRSGEARSRTGRRQVRKATMGSTSYDEARDPKDPNDPTWSGASWYGPSTGEYWIINPREYADPRKHGPEYQSRARRMAAAEALGEMSEDEPRVGAATGTTGDAGFTADLSDAGIGDEARGTQAAATGGTAPTADPPTPAGAPAARAGGAWSMRSPGRASAASGVRREPRGTRAANAAAWAATWPADPRSIRRGPPSRARRLSPRAWVGGAADDPVRRLGISLVAWPPIGLAAAALIGDLTGCNAYSAACGGTEPLLPWLAQAVILGLLLLLPPVARILAGGALGILVGLVPLTALLVAVGGTGAPQAGFALAFLLAFAWLAGVAWAVGHARGPAAARAGP